MGERARVVSIDDLVVRVMGGGRSGCELYAREELSGGEETSQRRGVEGGGGRLRKRGIVGALGRKGERRVVDVSTEKEKERRGCELYASEEWWRERGVS